MNFSEILKVGDWVELRNGEKGKVVFLYDSDKIFPIKLEIDGKETFCTAEGKYFTFEESDPMDIIRKIEPNELAEEELK